MTATEPEVGPDEPVPFALTDLAEVALDPCPCIDCPEPEAEP